MCKYRLRSAQSIGRVWNSVPNGKQNCAVDTVLHCKFLVPEPESPEAGEGNWGLQEHRGGCARGGPAGLVMSPQPHYLLELCLRKGSSEGVSGHGNPGPSNFAGKGTPATSTALQQQRGLGQCLQSYDGEEIMNYQEAALENRR